MGQPAYSDLYILCPWVLTGMSGVLGSACHCQLRSHGSVLWVGFISFPLVVGNQLSGWCSASLGKHGRHAGEMALHLSACCICSCSRALVPSTHVTWLTTACDSSSRNLMPLTSAHIHVYTY